VPLVYFLLIAFFVFAESTLPRKTFIEKTIKSRHFPGDFLYIKAKYLFSIRGVVCGKASANGRQKEAVRRRRSRINVNNKMMFVVLVTAS